MGKKTHSIRLPNNVTLTIKPLSWFSSLWVRRKFRMLVGSTLYVHKSKDPEQLPISVLMHEAIHYEQQRTMGPVIFWIKYYRDKDFRLACETEAIANELKFCTTTIVRRQLIAMYSHKLASIQYFWAADSFQHAFDEIYRKCPSSYFI